MVLPEAEKVLKKAGYAASVEDDALFGVIIPSHFTVCEQSEDQFAHGEARSRQARLLNGTR